MLGHPTDVLITAVPPTGVPEHVVNAVKLPSHAPMSGELGFRRVKIQSLVTLAKAVAPLSICVGIRGLIFNVFCKKYFWCERMLTFGWSNLFFRSKPMHENRQLGIKLTQIFTMWEALFTIQGDPQITHKLSWDLSTKTVKKLCITTVSCAYNPAAWAVWGVGALDFIPTMKSQLSQLP